MTIYQKPRGHRRRWRQLVRPLVPRDGKDRLFLDLGCNAGFYMQKAIDRGYRAQGVEVSPEFIEQASPDLNILCEDITQYKPPAAYLTLMACVHYHLTPPQVTSVLNQLLSSTAYLLVMGRQRGGTTSNPTRKHLMTLLDLWEFVDERDTEKLYTVLVKNKRVTEFSVGELYESTIERTKRVNGHTDFFEPFAEFVRLAVAGKVEEPRKTAFWKYLRKRNFKYRHGLCFWYENMIKEAQTQGIRSVLRIEGNAVTDGHHRLVVAKELGVERLLCSTKRKT